MSEEINPTATLLCIASLIISLALPSPEGIANQTVREITQTLDQITEDPVAKEINRSVLRTSETVFMMLAITSVFVSVMIIAELFV
jgi:hypothetical protein